jgi:hypothetical protein
MKIKLITDHGVWVDGQSRGIGYEADLDDATAQAMIDNGFAEEVKAKRAVKKAAVKDAE